mgnify:CR=1 FL=1|tara:strand:- start:524 stop:799 length:276 start_codon:yes stop_codon:yes gene_type:complete
MSLEKELENLKLSNKGLVQELHNLKKEIAFKIEEIQLLNLKLDQKEKIESSHKKINGQLTEELKEIKEDNKKLAKQIVDLEKQAKEMLNYP